MLFFVRSGYASITGGLLRHNSGTGWWSMVASLNINNAISIAETNGNMYAVENGQGRLWGFSLRCLAIE